MAKVPIRHPGTFGVQRPPRAVSLERPVGSAWLEALLAQAERGDPDTPRQPPGPTVPDWASNAVNSTLGGILGQGSLAKTQRAAAEWMAQGLSLPTPGGAMRQEGTADVIDTVLNLVRPVALADVGVAGSAGSMMFPFPGLTPGAAPAAGAARKAGGGITDALRRLLSRGGDEAVSAVAPAAASAQRSAGPGLPPLFHGTSDSFDTFTARNRPLLSGLGVQGTHVTPVEQIAARYGGEAGGQVHSVEWALDRPPRILDTAGPLPDDLVDAASELLTPRQAAELRTHGTLAEVLTLGDVRPGQVGSPDEGAVAKAVRAKLSELYDVTLERVMPLAGGDGSPEYIFLNPEHIRIGSTRLLGG